MFWDDLVSTIIQAKVKTCIYNNHHQSQRSFIGKQLLKIKDFGQNKQPTPPKNGVAQSNANF